MTVRELIKKLQKCSPDAIVCAEVSSDPRVDDVQEYLGDDGKRYVYIADDLEYIDEVIKGSRVEPLENVDVDLCDCKTREYIGKTDDGVALLACLNCHKVYAELY